MENRHDILLPECRQANAIMKQRLYEGIGLRVYIYAKAQRIASRVNTVLR